MRLPKIFPKLRWCALLSTANKPDDGTPLRFIHAETSFSQFRHNNINSRSPAYPREEEYILEVGKRGKNIVQVHEGGVELFDSLNRMASDLQSQSP
jgi:hypothetical protein